VGKRGCWGKWRTSRRGLMLKKKKRRYTNATRKRGGLAQKEAARGRGQGGGPGRAANATRGGRREDDTDGTTPSSFQAEAGIRDWSVTGVQTCALPICILLQEIENSRPLRKGIPGAQEQ